MYKLPTMHRYFPNWQTSKNAPGEKVWVKESIWMLEHSIERACLAHSCPGFDPQHSIGSPSLPEVNSKYRARINP